MTKQIIIKIFKKPGRGIQVSLGTPDSLEWFQNIVQFHADSDEGTELDQRVLNRLNEVAG